jgi:ATP-dependent DNA ligase
MGSVCEHELEGVVAKKRSGSYVFGERGSIKTKKRNYWRWEMEREGTLQSRRYGSSSSQRRRLLCVFDPPLAFLAA